MALCHVWLPSTAATTRSIEISPVVQYLEKQTKKLMIRIYDVDRDLLPTRYFHLCRNEEPDILQRDIIVAQPLLESDDSKDEVVLLSYGYRC